VDLHNYSAAVTKRKIHEDYFQPKTIIVTKLDNYSAIVGRTITKKRKRERVL